MSQQINLYAAHLRPRHEVLTGRNLGIATLVLLLLVGALAFWTRSQAARKVQAADALQAQVSDAQNQLTELSAKTAQRKASPGLIAEIEVAKTMLGARQEVLTLLESGALGNSSGFSRVMTGFARQTQADLWLTGFVLSAGGDDVEIRGRLLDSAGLPVYVQRLSDEPAFQGRRFAALEMHVGSADDRAGAGGTVAIAAPTGATATNGDDAGASPRAEHLPRFVEFVLRSEVAGDDSPNFANSRSSPVSRTTGGAR